MRISTQDAPDGGRYFLLHIPQGSELCYIETRRHGPRLHDDFQFWMNANARGLTVFEPVAHNGAVYSPYTFYASKDDKDKVARDLSLIAIMGIQALSTLDIDYGDGYDRSGVEVVHTSP